MRSMSKREYKLAAAFFLIPGVGCIFFAVDRFIDERALKLGHSTSVWAFAVGMLGVFAAVAIRIGAPRQQKTGPQ